MTPQILVVDDEERYRHLIRVNLEASGFSIITASGGEEAIEKMFTQTIDLIVLDVVMPRLDGFTTCERIRQFSNIPIIILTAKNDEQDRVRGLNVGADDYISKPFSATELVARVKAVLRRTQNSGGITQKRFFIHGDLKIDFAHAEVYKHEKPVYLSATEYRLLIQFAQNAGHVLTAEDLLVSVWGAHYRDDKEILWVSIARLRQKLEDNPHVPRHIVTRSGLGYLMPVHSDDLRERKPGNE
ncbi:MAG TPA: response regulator transcription factor [Anaerolineaceae bacterium]